MTFDYFYGTRADQYSFIRVPKLLITGKEFSSLTIQAKMLYGLLLDRMGMSIKNKWLDQEFHDQLFRNPIMDKCSDSYTDQNVWKYCMQKKDNSRSYTEGAA